MPRTYDNIRTEMLSLIESGKILLGDLISPKSFIKLKVNNGVLVQEAYQIHGRMIPLDEIRRQIYREHKKLGIVIIIGFISNHYVN